MDDQPPVPEPGGARDERALLARLRDRDEDAYVDLMKRHGPRLRRVATRLLGNDEDARDAVQETFLSAFRTVGAFAGDCALSTWLHRIAVNASLTKLRARRRRPEESIEPLLPAFQDDGHHERRPVRRWSRLPEQEAERREVRGLVRDAIDRLPESYRTVLVLRDIEGMDGITVAELLGINPNAVHQRLHRARLALRTLLDPRLVGAA